MGLGAGGILARLVSYDAVIEDEVVLCGDRDAVECHVRRVEARIEECDADARPIDPLIGERPEMELAVGHLRRAQHRIVSRTDAARVARSLCRRGDDAGHKARAAPPPPPPRALDPPQRLAPPQAPALPQ